MKRYGFYFATIVMLIASCTNKTNTSILTSANLPLLYITLDADSAYTLKTPKGAIIKISKNSFDVPANAQVNVAIKEAYSANDILLAGLSTTSDGKLLQSGGMIYFDATANGQDVKIIKPINISIPTKNYNPDMQLFKGEVKPDSTINWVDPQPLDSSATSKQLAAGKALFNQNCKSCHKPSEDFTGPMLAHCRDREPNKDWAYAFTDHTNTMIRTDPYAISLFRKYGSVMQQQNLTKNEIKWILDYCDNVAQTGEGYDSTYPSFDSTIAPCGYDTVYVPLTDTAIQIVPQDVPVADTSISMPIDNSIPGVDLYTFNIDQNGWYNIDCFINDNINAVTTVHLSADIINEPDSVKSLSVYLVIPSRKLITDFHGQRGSIYTVYYIDDDSVQLILNDKAFIFAVAQNGSNSYYGLTRFTVKEQQTINVTFQKSTREAITQALLDNQLDSIKIDPTMPELTPPNTVTGIRDVYDSIGNIIQRIPDTIRINSQQVIVPIDCVHGKILD